MSTELSLGDILQIFLAIIALFIAICEYIKILNEKKTKENRRKMMSDCADKADRAFDCIKDWQESIKMLNMVMPRLQTELSNPDSSTYSSETLQMAGGCFGEIKKVYTLIDKNHIDETIIDLYKNLLLAEELFSLSYGYGRFIGVLREYLMQMEAFSEIKTRFFDTVDNSKYSSTIVLRNTILSNFQALNNYNTIMKKLEVYVEELKLKYVKQS